MNESGVKHSGNSSVGFQSAPRSTAAGKQMPPPGASGSADRPRTAASLSLSSVGSMSISSKQSSLNGSQMNALVQRRSVLRTQMAMVEQQLAALPPSTAGSNAAASMPAAPAAPIRLQSSPILSGAPRKGAPPRMVPVPPRESKVVVASVRTAPPPSSYEDALPGAMRPGRYAFWPKRLPANQNRAMQRSIAAQRSLSH